MYGHRLCRGHRVLPPCHFGEPVGDMGTLRIQLAGLVKRGRRFAKLLLRQVSVPLHERLER
jgi:hypothetical protein